MASLAIFSCQARAIAQAKRARLYILIWTGYKMSDNVYAEFATYAKDTFQAMTFAEYLAMEYPEANPALYSEEIAWQNYHETYDDCTQCGCTFEKEMLDLVGVCDECADGLDEEENESEYGEDDIPGTED